MKYSLIFFAFCLAGAMNAQLPIRNYIFLNQDSIVQLLELEGMEFEVNDSGEYGQRTGMNTIIRMRKSTTKIPPVMRDTGRRKKAFGGGTGHCCP